MNIKIIAVDMDGTFLTADNRYDRKKFMEEYEEMKKRGICFVVASGNQYYQLRSFFPEIDKEIAFIAENGAYIIDQDEEVFVAELNDEDLKKVIHEVDKYLDMRIVVCGKKSAYVLETMSDSFFEVMNKYYFRLQRVADFNHLDDTIFKIYIGSDEDNFERIITELKESIGHIMLPVDCGHFGMDLIVPGMNKAHGLSILKEKWGIPEGEVMAFGDSMNDYEMLEYATYSFAMANAKDKIKEVADYTIASNEEGGVVKAIDWMLKKEEMFSEE